ncbi:kinase-like domain-containing protein, partial [Hysterangium stoloniferum]
KKFCREVLLWRQLRHDNVLPFLGLFQPPDRSGVAIISRWKPRGNLMDYIKDVRNPDRFKLMMGASAGLTYLHEHEPVAIHGNLKPASAHHYIMPENVLVNYDGKALLADFGSSQAQPELSNIHSSTETGEKYCYTAPELIADSGKPTTFSDVWALGMIIYVAFTGKRPYAELNKGQAVTAIQRGQKPQPPTFLATQRGLSSELWSYLEEFCWAKEPGERTLARNCRASLKAFEERWLENVDLTSPRVCVILVSGIS